MIQTLKSMMSLIVMHNSKLKYKKYIILNISSCQLNYFHNTLIPILWLLKELFQTEIFVIIYHSCTDIKRHKREATDQSISKTPSHQTRILPIFELTDIGVHIFVQNSILSSEVFVKLHIILHNGCVYTKIQITIIIHKYIQLWKH